MSDFYKLHPDIIILWRIKNIISTVFISICLFVCEYFLSDNLLDNFFLPFGVITITVFLIFLAFAIIYPSLKYNNWFFSMRKNEIEIKHGILTKVTTIAPLSRIQHIDVHQGIFERMFGLSTLILYTAGTYGADIVIPGLEFNYAVYIRDNIKDFSYTEEL